MDDFIKKEDVIPHADLPLLFGFRADNIRTYILIVAHSASLVVVRLVHDQKGSWLGVLVALQDFFSWRGWNLTEPSRESCRGTHPV